MDVTQAQEDGATPLYIASLKGHTEVILLLLAETVKILLQHEGIDVNLQDEFDAKAYYRATGSGFTTLLPSEHATVFVRVFYHLLWILTFSQSEKKQSRGTIKNVINSLK